MSLQQDYRPKTFKTFIGNKDVIESLTKVLKRKKIPSAFLFTGPSGCGKTTLPRIIAHMFKVDHDFKELNTANDRGIKPIRTLIDDMSFQPIHGDKKFILLDEAHMITGPAQEALLKALEEPPPWVTWLICTTNPEALKTTLKRRCHNYELSAIGSTGITKLLKRVLKKEKVEKFPQKVLEKIVDLSDGSPGIALKNLDMVIDFKDAKKAIRILKSSGATEEDVKGISQTLCNFNMSADAKWNRIKKILKNLKGESESIRRPILGYLEKVILNNGGVEIVLMIQALQNNTYDSGRAGLCAQLYQAVYDAEEMEDDEEDDE